MKRNELEQLQEEYPEVKQMSYNNKGFDFLMDNSVGNPVRIEEKFRSKGVKVDITPAQVQGCDIISLRDHEGKYYHMLTLRYLEISKPHSALASGWFGKERELSQKKFKENATTDLRILVEEVEFKGVNLTAWMT